MTGRRRLRCEPITDAAGTVIGYGRAAGPITDADRAIVAEFAASLVIHKEFEAGAAVHSGEPLSP